ncbi:LysR family transcriptional regulator [Ramlibacter sp.]|uniref:LysR family transcriptional regulator n=1 Tax=Ramlibacter sp. TaxID=1917967 RepID=UPI003D0B1A9A
MAFNRLHLIRQVDLFTLRLFLSAVEEQQIGRAAVRENIAASTATKRIQDLEEIAGVQLLERTPKGVSPTPAGAVLVRYLRAIFGNLDDMRAEISAFTEGMRGELAIASARSIIVPFLAREMSDFARDFPGVDLVLRELENATIVQAVTQGEADVGVFAVTPGVDLSGVDAVAYRSDKLIAAVPAGHPLATRTDITFDDLLASSLVAVAALEPALAAAARRRGREYKARFTVRSVEVALSLVQAGLGVTVVPEFLFFGPELSDNVVMLQLRESWTNRVIQVCTPRGRTPGPAARAFIKQLLDRPPLPG